MSGEFAKTIIKNFRKQEKEGKPKGIKKYASRHGKGFMSGQTQPKKEEPEEPTDIVRNYIEILRSQKDALKGVQ